MQLNNKTIIEKIVLNNLDYGIYNVSLENTDDGVKVNVNPGNIIKHIEGYKIDKEGIYKVTINENSRESVLNLDVFPKDKTNVRIEYSSKNITNSNVVATLVSDEPIIILNNNGLNYYIFDGSKERFVFEYKTSQGQIYTATAQVTWIDKKAPEGIVIYSTTDTTKNSVIAYLKTNEEVTILKPNSKENFYVFYENGEMLFEYKDKAGNLGQTLAKVDWIDKLAPTGTITYNITTLTNGNVIARVICDNDVVHVNSDGSHTFRENGEFVFEFKDDEGRIGKAKAIVNWISKELPTARVAYSENKTTNGNVLATLVADENITILDGDNQDYVFRNNGTHKWRIMNQEGNISEVIGSTTLIDREKPIGTIKYTESKEGNILATLETNKETTVISPEEGIDTYLFEHNGNVTFRFKDKAGNVGETMAIVDSILENKPLIVTGDYNGDGMKDILFIELSKTNKEKEIKLEFPRLSDAADNEIKIVFDDNNTMDYKNIKSNKTFSVDFQEANNIDFDINHYYYKNINENDNVIDLKLYQPCTIYARWTDDKGRVSTEQSFKVSM